jgi:hypothetical protein
MVKVMKLYHGIINTFRFYIYHFKVNEKLFIAFSQSFKMMFFGKKEGKKTELPPLPGENSLPELPQLPDDKRNSEFPVLPQTDRTKNNLDLGIIKSTIFPQVKKIGSASEYQPSFKPEEASESQNNMNYPQSQDKNEPIFVKIDKFRNALDNFNKIKGKVLEIEEELKKINEIKSKEEEELKEWESEIQSIKAMMNSIDNSLFNRVG